MVGGDSTEGLRNAGLAIIAFGVVVAGLVYGSSFLIPLAIAIFIWNVLEAMIQGFAGIRLGAFRLPRWGATILGFASVALAFYLVFSVLTGQVDTIAAAWPRYVARFEAIVADLTAWLGPAYSAKLREWLAAIDLTRQVPGLIASTQSLVLGTLLVVAYVGFLFAESGYASEKVAAMFPDAKRARERPAWRATWSCASSG
jgi:predicted PurR-regulated permease PerM